MSMYKRVNPFYKSTRWKNKRDNILRRDEYMCRECRRYGRTTQATHVHHIFELEKYSALALINDNLISLCNKCHEQMHNRVDYILTDKGIEWQNRNRTKIEKLINRRIVER